MLAQGVSEAPSLDVAGPLVVLAVLVVVGLVLAWLPTIVALRRKSDRALSVFLVNLLAGWTVIGWVVALVWALGGSSSRRPKAAAWTLPEQPPDGRLTF